MSDRANIEISATTSRLAAGLRHAKSMLSGFASTAARGMGSAFSKVKPGDIGKNALGHLGGNLATRGLDMLVEGATSVRDFERNLMRFQITTDGTAASTAALRKQIGEVAKQTGIAKDEVLAGASQYVALTGDAKGSATAMSAFARVAQASGSSVADVASATAALKTSMGLEAADIEAAFSGMIVQGKAGAVEIKDMAGELAELAPQFAQFRGGKGLSGIREMGSAFQVIRKGAGSASGAATQFQALMGELANPDTIGKLGKLKLKVFDKDPQTGLTTMRNASDIFEDIARNQKLADPRVIAQIFGRKESQAAIRSIQQHIGLYRDLRVAAEDTGAVQRDLSTYLLSDAGRIDTAFNNMKVKIADIFTPERIEQFAGALEGAVAFASKLIDKLEAVADWIAGQDAKEQAKKIAAQVPAGDRARVAKEFKIEGHHTASRRNTMLGAFGGVLGLGGLANTDVGRSASEKVLNVAGVSSALTGNDAITGKYHGEVAAQLELDPWNEKRSRIATAGSADSGVGGAAMTEMVRMLKVIAANTGQDRPVNAAVEISRDKVVDATRDSARQRTR